MWVIVGYVLLSLLGLLVLLLLSPVALAVKYRNGELAARVTLYGIPLWRYPQKKQKSPKTSRSAKKATEKASPLNEWTQRLKQKGVFGAAHELQELARLLGGWAGKLAHAVVVDRFWLHLVVASEDASSTAQNVGRVCAVVYPAMTTIQAAVRIRDRRITVVPDYLAEEGSVEGDFKLHLPIWRGVYIALYALTQYTKFNSRNVNNTEEVVENG